MSTDNLNIPEVSASQSQKEVTINEGLNALDVASNSELEVAVTGSSDEVSTADFFTYAVFRLTGTPGAPFTLTLPAEAPRERVFAVVNVSDGTVTLDSGGATVDVDAGEAALLHSDGLDIHLIASSGGASAGTVTKTLTVAVSDETTDLTTGTAKITFRSPQAMTLTDIRASLSDASSSGLVTVDVNEDGSTILSTKLSIDATEKTSTTATTPVVISDASIADDAEITIDIDAAGTDAKGLKVTFIYT